MDLEAVKDFCEVFYKRFSTLDLMGLKLKYLDAQDSCSIVLVHQNENEDVEAVVNITEDTVRLIKIESFEALNTSFIFENPLELFTNLFTLLVLSCGASKVVISPLDALRVTLGRTLKTWRELVIFICSLSPEDQGIITVLENHQNAVRLLKTSFIVKDHIFISDGLYKIKVPYKDVLELIRVVLDSLCAVFKIHGYNIDPFFEEDNPNFGPSQGFPEAVPEMGMAGMGDMGMGGGMGDMPPPISAPGAYEGTPPVGLSPEAMQAPPGSEGFPGEMPMGALGSEQTSYQ